MISQENAAGYAVTLLSEDIVLFGSPLYSTLTGRSGGISVVDVSDGLSPESPYQFKPMTGRGGQAVALLGDLDGTSSTLEVAVLKDGTSTTSGSGSDATTGGGTIAGGTTGSSSQSRSDSAEPPKGTLVIYSVESTGTQLSISQEKASIEFNGRSLVEFGMDVACLGDMDLDGSTVEVAVSSTGIRTSGGSDGDGGYHIISLSATLQQTKIKTFSPFAGRKQKLGYSATFLGDINSDGIAGELAVGSDGPDGLGMISICFHRRDLTLFSRKDLKAVQTVHPLTPVHFGRSIASMGTGLDGDENTVTLAVGDPGQQTGTKDQTATTSGVFVLGIKRTRYLPAAKVAEAAASTPHCPEDSAAPCRRLLYTTHDTILMVAPGGAPTADVVRWDKPSATILSDKATDLLASDSELIRIDIQPSAMQAGGVLGPPPAGDPHRPWVRSDYATVQVNGAACIISALDRPNGRIWCLPKALPSLAGWARVSVKFWNGHESSTSSSETAVAGSRSDPTACQHKEVPCVVFGPIAMYRDSTAEPPKLDLDGGQQFRFKSVGLVSPGQSSWPSELKLMIGPFECASPTVAFGTTAAEKGVATVTCPSTPAGIGGPHRVYVDGLRGGIAATLRDELQSSLEQMARANVPETLLEYEAPVVSGLLPSAEIAERDGNVTVTVVGDNFGPSIAGVDSIFVGGVRCGSVSYLSASQLKCDDLPANAFPRRDVVVRFRGTATTASGRDFVESKGGANLLQVPAAPIVVGAQPAEVPSTGGTVTLFGPNLDDPLDWVMVGSQTCNPLVPDTEFSVECGVPAGVGKDLKVKVRSQLGRVTTSSLGLVSYSAPVIDAVSISPQPVYSGAGVQYTAVIRGEHFGPALNFDLTVSVGGQPCVTVSSGDRNDTHIECGQLEAPWSSNDVVVTTGSQSVAAFGEFQFQQPTAVTSVSPSVLPTAGGSVTVQGEGFGNSPIGISVKVGSLQATDIQPAADGRSLTCTVPPGNGKDLDVIVSTTQNGASRPGSAAVSFLPPEVRWIAAAGSATEDFMQDPAVLAVARGRSSVYLGEQSVRMQAGVTNAGMAIGQLDRVRLAGNGFSLRAYNLAVLSTNATTGDIDTIAFDVDAISRRNVSTLPEIAKDVAQSAGRSWPVQLFFEVAGQASPAADLGQASDYPIDAAWRSASQSTAPPAYQPFVWILGGPQLTLIEPTTVPTAGSIDLARPGNGTEIDSLMQSLGIGSMEAVAQGTSLFPAGQRSMVRPLAQVAPAASGGLDLDESEILRQGLARIRGVGFGHAPWVLHSVTIGGVLSPLVLWANPSELFAVVPPDTGMGGRVSVRTVANVTEPGQDDGGLQLEVDRMRPAVESVSFALASSQDGRTVAYAGEPDLLVHVVASNAGSDTDRWSNLLLVSRRWSIPCLNLSVTLRQIGQVRRFQCDISLGLANEVLSPSGQPTGNNDTLLDMLIDGFSEQVSVSLVVDGIQTADPAWSSEQAPQDEPSGSATASPGPVAWVVHRPLVTQTEPSLIATEGLLGNRIDADESAGGTPTAGSLQARLREALDGYLVRLGGASGAGLPDVVEVGAILQGGQSVTSADLLEAGLVVVRGSAMGHSLQALLSVSIAGVGDSPLVLWLSQSELAFVPPAGTGAGRQLLVKTIGSQVSEDATVRYSSPQVTGLDPPYGLTGLGHLSSFSVSGRHFGSNASALQRIVVGGRACRNARYLTQTTVQCIDAPSNSWASRRVTVVVDGQESFPNAIFTPLDPPTVRAVSPAVAKVGQTILVLGDNFGQVPSDVARVTIAGQPCLSLQHEGPTALTCDMPEPAASLQQQALSDPRALRDLPVVVESAAGVASPASPNATVTFATLGTPLDVAPENIVSWRAPGKADRLVLRWSLPDSDYDTDGIEPVSTFDVETWAADSTTGDFLGEGTEESGSAVTQQQVRRTDVTEQLTRDDILVFRYNVPALEDTPMRVRIRGFSDAGPGPWSGWSLPVPSTCVEGEYLDTSSSVGTWECKPCDDTIVQCTGAVAQLAAAAPGYQRLPWTGSAVAFAECPMGPLTCLGGQSGEDDETARGAGGNNSQTAAGPQPRLLQASTAVQLPSLDEALAQDSPASSGGAGASAGALVGQARIGWYSERCADGYSGLLCATCVPGYTRWGTYECRRCADATYIILAAAGVGVMILAGIIALSAQALKRGSEEEQEIMEKAVKMWRRRLSRNKVRVGSTGTKQLSVPMQVGVDKGPRFAANVLARSSKRIGSAEDSDSDTSVGGMRFESSAELTDAASTKQTAIAPSRPSPTPARPEAGTTTKQVAGQDKPAVDMDASVPQRAVLVRQATERFDAEASDSIGVAVIKIAFSHLQTIAIASQFDLEWPQSLHDMFAAFSTTTSAASDVISLDCMLNSLAPADTQGDWTGVAGRASSALLGALNASSNGSTAGTHTADAWPHPTAEDVEVLREAERSHALALAESPPPQSWLVEGMPAQSSYFASALVILSFPLVLALVIALLWFVMEAIDGCLFMPRRGEEEDSEAGREGDSEDKEGSGKGEAGPNQENTGSDNDRYRRGPCCGVMADERRTSSLLVKLPLLKVPVQAARLPYLSKVVVTMIVVAFILHITVTDTSLGLLTCTDVESSFQLGSESGDGPAAAPLAGCPAGTEHRRLVRDLNVCCYNSEAMAFTYGVGIPGVILYAIGIPLAALALLLRYKDDMHKPQTRALLSFLRAGFRRDVLYWEVVIMLRKFAISAVVVFLEPFGVRIQTYASLAILFAVTVAHVNMQPYSHKRLNNLEFGVLCTAFATFEAGLFLHDPSSGQATRLCATLLVIVANSAALGWAAYIAAKDLLPSAMNSLSGMLGLGGGAGGAAGGAAASQLSQRGLGEGQGGGDTMVGALVGGCCGCCGCLVAAGASAMGRSRRDLGTAASTREAKVQSARDAAPGAAAAAMSSQRDSHEDAASNPGQNMDRNCAEEV